MNLRIDLKPESENLLRNLAERDGVDVEAFVKSLLEERLQAMAKNGSHEESAFARKLDHWIGLHPKVTHFVDDSRESIWNAGVLWSSVNESHVCRDVCCWSGGVGGAEAVHVRANSAGVM